MEIIKSLISKLPINKIKIALIVATILFIIGLIVNLQIVNNKLAKERADNDRLVTNQIQLTGEKRQIENYAFRLSEVNGALKIQIDSLARALHLKPKYITRIEYRTITEVDSVDRLVYVQKTDYNRWTVQDSDKCWTWTGMATLDTIKWDLQVIRNNFEYTNKITETFYRKKPAGFWGFLKKRVNYHAITPKCGEATLQTFTFTK
jgi:hypothetical protein